MSDAGWIETLAYDIQSQCSSWELSMAGDAMATFDVCGAKLLIQRVYAEHCRSVDPDKLAERIAEACYDADGTIISVGIAEELLAPILARNAAMEAELAHYRCTFAKIEEMLKAGAIHVGFHGKQDGGAFEAVLFHYGVADARQFGDTPFAALSALAESVSKGAGQWAK